MPMNAANTRIIEAGHNGMPAHGIYPGVFLSSALGAAGVLATHQYVILWAREQPGLYPTMHATQRDPSVNLNGGVAADPDHLVATYGVYLKKGVFRLQYWVDFDHWPLVADAPHPTLMPGLADGHYHPGTNTAQQLAVNAGHRELGLRIEMYVRFGQF
jgi:hypothetical protein